jgi:hypothetical protein
LCKISDNTFLELEVLIGRTREEKTALAP